mmetsp:Transcript_21804/g.33720  ORF Transcript_21804/g.33720 Transcript_21804/m.33720 type:complete len:103 (+) Transcript_21804:1122-1430(+)
MDKDRTGFISAEELRQAFHDGKLEIPKMTEDQISKIIEEVDEHKNGKINYSEFLAATVSIQQFMTEEKLWMIFKHFDVDDTDFISRENISAAMKQLGKNITD